ncbi:MAG TPA: hypothetical protein VEU53_07400 [Stellaceae bacterium]|nr:hypothetical protein [Stellaceae bacterium]
MAKSERAEELHRQITTYRRQLAEGVPGDTARLYLIEIANAEAELAEIEQTLTQPRIASTSQRS